MRDKVLYRHLKPDGEVFYIGIGNMRRPYLKSGRGTHWSRVVSKYGYEVQILKTNLTWEEACELEKVLISWYGRINLGTGPLVNHTDGGDGCLGYKHTKLSKDLMSSQRRGKPNGALGRKWTEDSKNKLSESCKGRIFSDETKSKLSEALLGNKRALGNKQSPETIAKRVETQRLNRLKKTKFKVIKL